MDMLMSGEDGIAPALADWLLDYCQIVTPPKFHDVARHVRKVLTLGLWESLGRPAAGEGRHRAGKEDL